MDWLLIGVIGVIVLALVFDFTNGFHDAANSVATVVTTRALPVRWAPRFSAASNFSAFLHTKHAVGKRPGLHQVQVHPVVQAVKNSAR